MDLEYDHEGESFLKQAAPTVQILPEEVKDAVKEKFVKAYDEGVEKKKAYESHQFFIQKEYEPVSILPIKNYTNIWMAPQSEYDLDEYRLEAFLKKYLFSNLQHLVNIEFEIDVMTQDFIKMPSGTYVYEVINYMFNISSVCEMFDYYVGNCLQKTKEPTKAIDSFGRLIYKETIMTSHGENMETLMTVFIPILNWVGRILEEKFCYMVGTSAFNDLITAPALKRMVYSSEEILAHQTKEVDKCNTKMDATTRSSNRLLSAIEVRRYIATLLAKRTAQRKKNEHFFAEVKEDQWDFVGMAEYIEDVRAMNMTSTNKAFTDLELD